MTTFNTRLTATLENIERIGGPREVSNLRRRVLKLGEELGEVAQAYLAVTSKNNYKLLTFLDLREESVDVFVVAADLMFHLECPSSEGTVTEPGALLLRFDLDEHRRRMGEMDPVSAGALPADEFEPRLALLYAEFGLLMTMLLEGRDPRDCPELRLVVRRIYEKAFRLMMQDVPLEPTPPPAVRQNQVLLELERKVSKWARLAGVNLTAIPA